LHLPGIIHGRFSFSCDLPFVAKPIGVRKEPYQSEAKGHQVCRRLPLGGSSLCRREVSGLRLAQPSTGANERDTRHDEAERGIGI